MRYLYIAIAGGVGSLLRYALTGVTYRFVEPSFPWGTLVVNALGCLVIGFLYELFEAVPVSPDVRMAALVGLVGGFTTFSTFSIETVNLVRDGEVFFAAANVVAHVVVGLGAVVAGIAGARELLR